MKNKPFLGIKGNQGLSIIEVIVSLVLLTLFSFGVFQFIQTQNKVLRAAEAELDILEFMGQARLVLSQPKACLDTFNGKPIQSPSDLPLNKIRGANVVPNSHPVAWYQYDYKSTTQDISDTKQVSLDALTIKYPPSFNGEAKLVFTFTKKGPAAFGGAKIQRTIPITIEANPSAPTMIGKCYASGAYLANFEAMCMSLGGQWDGAKCKDLFDVHLESTVLPSPDHFEKLEYDSDGKLKVKVLK